jgi:hypothetical protein
MQQIIAKNTKIFFTSWHLGFNSAFRESQTKSESSELSQIISEAIQKSLKLNPELLEQHKAEIILEAIFNTKTDLQKSKTQPKKDILFGNVNQLIFDLYCSVDPSNIKTITKYLIREYPHNQISNIFSKSNQI